MKLDLGKKTTIVISLRPLAVTVIRWDTRHQKLGDAASNEKAASPTTPHFPNWGVPLRADIWPPVSTWGVCDLKTPDVQNDYMAFMRADNDRVPYLKAEHLEQENATMRYWVISNSESPWMTWQRLHPNSTEQRLQHDPM